MKIKQLIKQLLLFPFAFVLGCIGVIVYDLGEMINYAKFKKEEKKQI